MHKIIPMSYALGADQVLTVKGTLEMPKFALDAALTTLDATCHDYHAGADGVSKVDPSVDLEVTVPVQTTCTN